MKSGSKSAKTFNPFVGNHLPPRRGTSGEREEIQRVHLRDRALEVEWGTVMSAATPTGGCASTVSARTAAAATTASGPSTSPWSPTTSNSLHGAGIPFDRAELAGDSLIDVIAQGDADRAVLSEYHDGASPSGIFMLRTQRWEYVHYVGYPPQQFDLEADPPRPRIWPTRPATSASAANSSSGCGRSWTSTSRTSARFRISADGSKLSGAWRPFAPGATSVTPR